MFQFQLAAESASWPTQHMTRGCTAWWKSAGGGLCLAVVARRQISAGEELCLRLMSMLRRTPQGHAGIDDTDRWTINQLSPGNATSQAKKRRKGLEP